MKERKWMKSEREIEARKCSLKRKNKSRNKRKIGEEKGKTMEEKENGRKRIIMGKEKKMEKKREGKLKRWEEKWRNEETEKMEVKGRGLKKRRKMGEREE